MKIVYMGTPEIAKVCLEKLYTEGFDIAAVYTKPDTPKNRGMKLIASEVKTYAQSVGLPVYQPETFRDDAVVEELKGLAPDLIIVVAYGKILPQRVLDIPRCGCINMHASILPELRDAVRTVSADIVCLQEVMGAHEVHPLHVENWPDTSHYEFLADTMWSDFAYGRNAVYPEGHHGNAVLSRYPIEHYENRDVSVDGAEKRGVLYCRIVPPMTGKAIHVMCVHLGLREAHRQAQLAMLAEWVNELPDGEPVLVAGDFNDWRQKANHPLKVQAGLDEIFTRAHGRPARTFPVQFPLLRLDRIYVKNASASAPTALPLRTWRHLSDHAPLSAEIHL